MDLFLEVARKRLTEIKTNGEKAIRQLTDPQQLHWRPNDEANSVATIVRHLSGNMKSRWTNFLVEDGEKSTRNRPSEFYLDFAPSIDEVWHLWNEGWKYVFTALDSLSAEHLAQTVTIRGEPLTVVDAIVRQIVHYANHVGQIVYICKILLSETWQSLSIPRLPDERYSPT